MGTAEVGTVSPILKAVPLLKNSRTLGKSQIFWDPDILSIQELKKLIGRLLLVQKMLMILILTKSLPATSKVIGNNGENIQLGSDRHGFEH